MANLREVSWPVTPEECARGTLFYPNKDAVKPYRSILISHGMTSNELKYSLLAEKLAAELGAAVLTINLRGHGHTGQRSDGSRDTLTVAELRQDIVAAYNYLISLPDIDPNGIGAIGASVSGFLIAASVGECAFQSLLLRAPAPYAENSMHLTLQQTIDRENNLFQREVDERESPALIALSTYMGSLEVVLSEQDMIIPEKAALAFLKVASLVNKSVSYTLLGAQHDLRTDDEKELFLEIAVDWFELTLYPHEPPQLPDHFAE